jgi:hypothetical protein
MGTSPVTIHSIGGNVDSRQLTTPNMEAFCYSLLGILDVSHGEDCMRLLIYKENTNVIYEASYD